MGTPTKPDDTKGMRAILQILMSENVSAQSALNMQPEPIPDHGSRDGYLSETDGWCKHSMEHLRNMFQWENLMVNKLDRMEDILFQLHKAGKINGETLDTLLETLRGKPTL